MQEKNNDSLGVYIENRTKLYKTIFNFNFQPLIFLIAGQRSKKHIFGNTEKKNK